MNERGSIAESTMPERTAPPEEAAGGIPLALAGMPSPVPLPDKEPDFASSEYYLNRELTWLAFNERVLHEAEDVRTPLLERVKFLSIVGSNLDEFVMKRVGGLMQQEAAHVRKTTVDGRTPREQIDECREAILVQVRRMQDLLCELIHELREQNIVIAEYDELPKKDREWLRHHYLQNIFPLVTPQAMDPAHPFPFISNLSLNLLVVVRHPKEDAQSLVRVKVPVGAGIPRFLRLRDEDTFVPLEMVIASNLDLLLPGVEIESCELFRVTRNANTELDEEEAEDLLALIETELRERKFAPIVRLDVEQNMSHFHRGMLAAELGLDEADVAEIDGMLGISDLLELANLERPELHDPPHHPIDHPQLTKDANIFHVIRNSGPLLLQHPYESFSSSVERFIREASEDPKVRAIKLTIYRTSAQTNIIEHLINAARNGKQVAVAVELKARFDEEANIEWASRLEEVGVHVSYGVVGLKTHCKIVLVVREDYSGLTRYAHVGTGNYHAGTARIYSDFGLLTCDDQIGADLTELFNYLTTGIKPKRNYGKILPAPAILKKALLAKIAREVELQAEHSCGHVQMKMNALEDADVTRALYEAGRAGVKVDLIVRDTCRLRPQIPGVTENVHVVSIVGRFLEHGRVYYFANNGKPEYYIGSADCMKRNLEGRVECVVPVEDERLQDELRFILNVQLADQRSAWQMRADGVYQQRRTDPESPSSQQSLIEAAQRRSKEASRRRKRRAKGVARRRAR